MFHIFLLSLVAAANLSLLAAVTVMLFLPDPKRLLLGYLLGGLLISLTISLLVAFVLRGGHDQRLKERRHAGKPVVEKSPSRVEQLLGRGSARITFALGVVLTLPGFSYLVALRDLQDLGYGTAGEVLVIVGFNVMLLILLEVPLAGYYLAPERTVAGVQRFRELLTHRGRAWAIVGFAVIGGLLIARGAVGYLT